MSNLARECRRWLSDADVNIFATVTLKQAVQSDNGTILAVDPFEVARTARILRDRVTKKLVSTTAFKKKRDLPTFLVFREGDGEVIRHHLHIAAKKPDAISCRFRRRRPSITG